MGNKDNLFFKVHLPNLLNEVMNNPGTWVLLAPMTITKNILAQMAEDALKSGNMRWIAYCGRLGLYEACTPTGEGYEEMQSILKNEFGELKTK